MRLSEANSAKLATTVPTGSTVSHWNGPKWARPTNRALEVYKIPTYQKGKPYVEFIYLAIYPPIASKESEGGNREMRKGGRKKRRFL